jgi:hypothetical protein
MIKKQPIRLVPQEKRQSFTGKFGTQKFTSKTREVESKVFHMFSKHKKRKGKFVLDVAVFYGRFRVSRIVTTLIMATNMNKAAMAGKK